MKGLGTVIGAATGGLLGPEQWLPANLVAGAVPALVTLWALLSEDVSEQDGPAPTSAGTWRPRGQRSLAGAGLCAVPVGSGWACGLVRLLGS